MNYRITIEPYLLLSCCFLLLASFVIFLLVQTLLHQPPFVPSRLKNIKRVFNEVGINSTTKFIDLGSGDGRIVFVAASLGALATGVEINPYLVIWCRLINIFKRNKAKFIRGSYFKINLAEYNFVFLYLYPEVALKLEQKIFSELKPGSIVVANTFNFARPETGRVGDVYWYRV
jgi:SAM-dependent methyltransferase